MATKRSALRSARSMSFIRIGISPNQTTSGRSPPARPQSGQACAGNKSFGHSRTPPQRWQLALHVDDPPRPCALVQIVDVLRHQGEMAAALGGVGFGVEEVAAAQIIER